MCVIHQSTRTTAVYVELLGRINLKKLKAQGVTVPEMLRFYIFLTEYIWRVLEPDEGEVRHILFVYIRHGIGVRLSSAPHGVIKCPCGLNQLANHSPRICYVFGIDSAGRWSPSWTWKT